MTTMLRFLFTAFAFAAAAQAVDMPSTPTDTPAAENASVPPKPDVLASAVRERRVVTFVYQGQSRMVEPHACGVAVATGEAVLHGFQVDGGSVSGLLPGWRTFSVSKITDFAVTDRVFTGPRPDYAAGRPHLAPLWAELAAATP